MHRTMPDLPPQIGVLVELDKADADLAKGVAQHIAAFAPKHLSKEDVPAEVVESERRVAEETTRAEGKPEAALPKIVEGRVNGFFKEATLLGQPYALDNKKSVQKVLDEAGCHPEALRAHQGRHLSPYRDRRAAPIGSAAVVRVRRHARVRDGRQQI